MYNSTFPMIAPEVKPFLFLLWAVDIALRGIALYKSAKRDQSIWFIALLLVNSMGILPVIYLVLQKDIALTPSAKSTVKKSLKKKK